MDAPLHPAFTLGTHRLVTPEQTMARIEPLLPRLGITRIADITGLDHDFAVPTYTAVRPGGLVLQTGNGKGLTAAAARVSAAMEAIELYHAENPEPGRLVRATVSALHERGLDARIPQRDQADRGFYCGPDYHIDWVRGEELIAGTEIWVPASAGYFIEPTVYRTNTNGLASGNHTVEATLHAVYEIIERDAISRLVAGDAVHIGGVCRVVDTATIHVKPLRTVVDKIRAAHSQLVLMWVPAQAPVHVLWAILLNHQPHRAATAFTTGAGAHVDIEVAAARAITEAIQSRLTIIQAARDDISQRASFRRDDIEPGPMFRFFAELRHDTRWDELTEQMPAGAAPHTDLRARLSGLLANLSGNGHDNVIRLDLTRPEFAIPVVKVLIPSMTFHRHLF